MDSSDVKAVSREAGDHPALETAARVGYAVNGLLHVMIGVIALQLAWASSELTADQSGALGALSGNPFGKLALWVAVVGWLGLGLWQVTEAITGVFETTDRVKAAAKAVVYLVLSWTAFGFARGGKGDSGKQSTDFTRWLLGAPLGVWLVGLVGLVVVGVGVYHVVKGWKRKFLSDLESDPGDFVEVAGRYGYIAKGIALGVVGGLFVLAAARHRPSEADGLDGALHTLLEAPGGKALLTIVALGLIAYGVYSFGRARHADV